MTGSAFTRWTLYCTCDSFLQGRGSGGGITQKLRLTEGPADDGKRFYALDVVFPCDSFLQGRGSGGGITHRPRRTQGPAENLADDGKRFYALDVVCVR